MRKIIVALLVVVSLAVSSQAIELPNLEGSQLYDFAGNRSLTALTSRVLSYKDVDLRVGYAVSDSETVIASLSYDLDNLKHIVIFPKLFYYFVCHINGHVSCPFINRPIWLIVKSAT